MNYDRLKTYGRTALRLLGLLVLVGGVLVLGLLGWQWQKTVAVSTVAVSGVHHASADTLRRLTRVDSGAVMETIEERLVADRVARHPWVEDVDVTKQRVRRTLHVAVTERTPAALVIDVQGRPVYYLDRGGHAMPMPDSGGADVPLVRGLQAEYHPRQTVAPPALTRLLSALPSAEVDDLVAEIVVQPDSSVRVMTAPIGDYGTVPVRLGKKNHVTKLRRLRAFAEQVLATNTDKRISEIDLRFDGQIVTRDHSSDG